MGFNPFSIINDLTGATAVKAAKDQAAKDFDFQKDVFDLLRQTFDQGLAAVSAARAGGAFSADKIRESVQRNVDNLIKNIADRGIVSGAQEGDTVQLENVAKGVITGSRALADVDFTALMRELGAIGAIPTGGIGAQAGVVGATSAAGQQGVAAAQSASNARLGQLASIGFQFLGPKPDFSQSPKTSGFRPGSFG